jgi:predicted PurR-regulated permease PerM
VPGTRNDALPTAEPGGRPAVSVEVVTQWPSSQTRAVLRLACLLLFLSAGLWMLYALQGVILLLVLSTFFAYLIAPLVELVVRPIRVAGHRWLIPRAVAIGIVYLSLFASIGIAGYVLLPRLGTQVVEFSRQVPTYVSHARDQLQAWRYFIDPDHFPLAVREAVENTLARTTEAAGDYLSYGFAGLLPLLGYLPWFILIPILAFFLLKDAETFRRSILLALPRGRVRGRGAELFEDVNDTLAAYIRAALLGCLLIGVVCTIGFMLIRLPHALLFGVLAGLLEFVPLVGPLVVALGTGLVAGFHSTGQAAAVLLFLGALRLVQDYVVFPRLVRRGIHMHPLGVILAILCGAELAGVAGIFLAIPVVAVLSVSYRHWLEHRGSAGLVTDLLNPAESAEPLPVSTGPRA